MEMTIFAFGLLDALVRNGLPLIFKGGTSLLLILDKPMRVSTDIDIIVPPACDFDRIFERVKKQFPFYEGEERGEKPNRYFRHFYFFFNGPIAKKPCRINLDVAFEDNPYPTLIEKELSLPFLLTTGEKTYATIPSIASLLGDKLTAFAPTSIGVNAFATSLGKPIDNRLQVMKQFYDIATLSDCDPDLKDVLVSYERCLEFENAFRNTAFSKKDALMDAFHHAAEVASMGTWKHNVPFYASVAKPGIQGLRTNTFDGAYNLVDAQKGAAKIMLLVSGLLSEGTAKSDIDDVKNPHLRYFKSVSDKVAFDRIRQSLILLTAVGIL